AQRSSSAAKEIKDLISASVQKIRDGSALADEAGKTMTEVTQAVARVTDIMGEIAAASAEQSRGIDQVNLAITQMDQVTQQNAALVEEAAAASQSLEDQGRELKQAVAFFRVDGMAADAVAQHRRIAAPTFAAATASAPRAVEASKPAASTAAAAARAPAVAVARAPAAADANADWETF
ncbi:methyl-accepting chemotaxis protein, partial [Burkholderia oklahomensis]